MDAEALVFDLFGTLVDVRSVETACAEETPDPRAFRGAVYALAERRLSLPRARLLFVSSNAWDVAGARAFGLRVAWVNRAGAPWRDWGPGRT